LYAAASNFSLLASNAQVNRQELKLKHLFYWDGAKRANRSERQMNEGTREGAKGICIKENELQQHLPNMEVLFNLCKENPFIEE
jgi:hypothetical protein